MGCDVRTKLSRSTEVLSTNANSLVIHVVGEDPNVSEALRRVLQENNYAVEEFATCEAFLSAYNPQRLGCLILDANPPGMSGLDLLEHLRERNQKLPTVLVTGEGDVPTAVKAMKLGAADCVEKPVAAFRLIECLTRMLEELRKEGDFSAIREAAARNLSGLTRRQYEIMEMVLAGHPSKNIAADLRISQRTVENHRAAIMAKTGMKSLPALTRLAMMASWQGAVSA